MYDCTASMVIYNNPPEMIRNAVATFLDTDCSKHLTIVDTSPTPDLRSAFDGLPVSYHLYGENVGYGKAHNWAIFHSEPSKYHLILNPDIIISPGAISALIKFMDTNPDIGLVCPKILNEDGSIQYLNKRYPTVFDLFLRRFLPSPLKLFFQKRLDYYEMKDVGYDSAYDVPFLTGCFMFCRKSVLKEIGGFDPEYFLYFEDVDLCRRIQRIHRTVYNPSVSVIHYWKREAHKNWLFTYYFICSAFRYFNRWGYKFL